MLKVFPFFKVKFDKYELTEVSIQCNRCNKTVTGELYETANINILPIFIKGVMFHHVGLSWMIPTKDQY